MKGRKEIVYPFFLHCCRETEDTFWKYIFEDLAFGIGPYGVYFSKDFMCCGFRGKEFSYKIDQYKTTTELYTEVRDLLHGKLGLRSPRDIVKQRKDFENTEKKFFLYNCNDWTEIRKKEIRDLLLKKYAIQLSKDGEWNRARTKKFLSSLLLALQLKVIIPTHITVKNGEIINIENVETIEKGLRHWNFDWRYKIDPPSKKFLATT